MERWILYYTWHDLQYSILYYTILYYTILYYTILYYTILYYTMEAFSNDTSLLWRAIYIYIYIYVCVCVSEGSARCCRVPGCFPKHSGIPLPGEGSPKAVRGWQQSHSVYLREFVPHNKIFIHASCFKYRPSSKSVQKPHGMLFF